MADKEIIAEEVKEETMSEENKNEGSGKKKQASTKSIVTKCIAAVLCAAIAGYTVSASIGKLAEAMKPVEGASASQSGDEYSDGSFDDSEMPADSGDISTGDDTAAPADEGNTAADAGTSDDTGAATDTGSASSDTTGSKTDAGSAADSKPASAASMTKGQVITLFNNAANGAKSNAKSIKQNYTKNTQVSSIELKNKALASLADKLIAANMGEDMAKHDKTYTGGDKAGYFPVAGQSWASKLTEADVKSATIKENGNTYSVVINLVDDTQKNLKAGEGHAGKAISLVTKEQIVEGAGSAGMAFIDEDSIKVGHSGCVIKATIDKTTGNLKTANYYRVWKLELTAIGIDVGISFGIEEDYVINW